MEYIDITHGSHIHSILWDDSRNKAMVITANEWEYIYKENYDIKDEDWSIRNTQMIVRKYEMWPFTNLVFAVLSKDEKNFELKTFYPYINPWHWTRVDVEITDIMEDKQNNFEWVIGCSLGWIKLYFFDPYYFINKNKYEVWKTYTIEISWFIYEIAWLTEEDSKIEVNRSLEQRKQMWAPIEYDEDWNLKPIYMDTTTMNQFVPSHEWYWDIQFQCKMKEEWNFNYDWEKVYAIELEINNGEGVEVPFIAFTRESNISNKETFWDWMPVRWVLLLQWSLCE